MIRRTATGVVACDLVSNRSLSLIWISYLQHLDECHGEEEVCGVREDQAQAEEGADWDNCAQIDSACHRDFLSRIKEGSESSHPLGRDGRKYEMPCGEEDGELEPFPVQDPFVEDDDG